MARRPPNILLILADDLGWNDLGASGSPFYESPNIDRIARQGMQFTQAYAACQVCSPSRASILTGKVTPRHGVTDWIGAASGAQWRRHGRHTRLLPAPYRHELGADEITLPAVLREGGYRTLFVGKWHLGDVGAHPEDRGFDVNVGGWKAGSPMGGYFDPYQNPRLPNRKRGECLPLRLAHEMSRLIEDCGAQPFLAYLPFYSVHGPVQTSRDRWERFRQKAVAAGNPDRSRFAFDRYLPVRRVQDCPVYAGMIEAMDEAVGIVQATLERLGVNDQTIVIFTSDNGGVVSGDSYSTTCLPLRGGKGRQWEGGIREPLYARVPGLTRPGSTCAVPVSGIDFYPTLLELAGLRVPEAQRVDGVSLVPLLRGEPGQAIAARDLFWHYPHYGNQGGEPCTMMRRGDWKLIHSYESGQDELYDLASDPGEQYDVAARHPELAGDLKRGMERWLAEVGARLPEPDSAYDPDAARARLADLETRFMAELEAQHRAYLDPAWEPNPDWWGSQVGVD
ncbi:MAG: sulfatase [Candidatus Latescibacterota bacterium]